MFCRLRNGKIAVMVIVLSLVSLIAGGCAGHSSDVGVTPTNQGVTVNAQASNLTAARPVLFPMAWLQRAFAAATPPPDGHPAAQHKLITPLHYMVGLKSARLQNAAAAPTLTYQVFDRSVADPVVVNLLANGQPALCGANATKPTAGTYTHMRAELVFLEMEFRSADSGVGRIRWYMSSTGPNNGTHPQQGDVQQLDPSTNTFKWVDSATRQLSSVRPAMPVNQAPFPPGTPAVDPFNDTLLLGAPFVVPAGDVTAKTATMTFDTLNTFFFEDFNLNGKFEPGIAGEGAVGTWFPGPPGVTLSLI